MVRRAHADEDKTARRDGILAAALSLFLDDTRRLPAVAAIAVKAGLAKGTVYLYFETKEQIFAALLSREWDALLADVEISFTGEGATRENTIRLFIGRFSDFLTSRAYFLRLDSLGYGLLEANLPADEFWRFKDAFSLALGKAGTAVDRALSLPDRRGLQLLIRSYALTKGLWQTLDLPDRVRGDQRFENHPLASVNFEVELKAALTEYWHGAIAQQC